MAVDGSQSPSKGGLPKAALAACVLAAALSFGAQHVPVELALQSRYVVGPAPALDGAEGGRYDDFLPKISAEYGAKGYPLILRPAESNFTSEELAGWIVSNKEWLEGKLFKHGAILLRGFHAVAEPQDFEIISMALEPDLSEEYLGTSPRLKLNGTRFVHSASEFPSWRIIAAHGEMSFLHNPPRRQFFFAYEPNESPGGETPVTDWRQVLRDMDPAVLRRFRDGRVRYIRQYYDEREGTYDTFKMKSWQAMFSTGDVAQAAKKSVEQGFDWEFERNTTSGDIGGAMKLVHTMDATRIHPVTGEEIWLNHMNVLHITSYPAEYAFSAQHLRSWKYVFLHYAFEIYVRAQMYLMGEENLGHHVTHADGVPMRPDDVDHIRSLVWRNTLIYRHEKHDIVMLDNWRMGHGRQPYTGHRRILTSWK